VRERDSQSLEFAFGRFGVTFARLDLALLNPGDRLARFLDQAL
jgi:hypothetical protein